MSETVAILGASDRPNKFAYKAYRMLKDFGHKPIPVNPHLKNSEDLKVYASVKDIPERVDTLTLYVGPKISTELVNDIVKLNPKRVIFNPGSENSILKNALNQVGIEAVEDCTLVMLQANRF